MMVEFDTLPERAQVHRLRATALAALAQYPIDVGRLRLLHHGYNTTFRVDTVDGRRFALRINTNSRKTPAALRAESEWLAALRRDTDVTVPSPQRTRDGQLTTTVDSADLGRPLPAALFGWLPGADLSENASVGDLRQLGGIVAALHAHTDPAGGWTLPDGARLPLLDEVLVDVPYHLDDEHPELTPERRVVLDAAFARCQDAYDEVRAGHPQQPLHADVHLDNVKRHRGLLALFDFDDCGVGAAVHDLAISAYYLRPRADLEAALIEGYGAVRTVPSIASEQYEALVAARSLVLVNDLFVTHTASWRALLPRFVARTVIKLRHFLDTGEFRHDLPDLPDLVPVE